MLSKGNGLSIIKSDQFVPRDHHSRNLLWTSDTDESSIMSNLNKTEDKLNLPMCPMSVNQTESVRLALELHR